MYEKIPIDPLLRPVLVGKGGQNLAKAKAGSGVASLDVNDDFVGVIGTPQQVRADGWRAAALRRALAPCRWRPVSSR
eukprot:SAG11_NODE_14354_length_615_cov_1.391473_1_plen_77_part_00